jgi:bacteriocin-like protein
MTKLNDNTLNKCELSVDELENVSGGGIWDAVGALVSAAELGKAMVSMAKDMVANHP